MWQVIVIFLGYYGACSRVNWFPPPHLLFCCCHGAAGTGCWLWGASPSGRVHSFVVVRCETLTFRLPSAFFPLSPAPLPVLSAEEFVSEAWNGACRSYILCSASLPSQDPALNKVGAQESFQTCPRRRQGPEETPVTVMHPLISHPICTYFLLTAKRGLHQMHLWRTVQIPNIVQTSCSPWFSIMRC